MDFIKSIFLLIISPSVGWDNIKKYNIPINTMQSRVLYPMLALLAISTLISSIYVAFSVSSIIQKIIIDSIKYVLSYYFSIFLLSMFCPNVNADKNVTEKVEVMLLYCVTILIFFNILSNLMPDFSFFIIFPLYIIYVVYCGLSYIDVKHDRPKFVIVTSILLLTLPTGINLLLNYLLPNP